MLDRVFTIEGGFVCCDTQTRANTVQNLISAGQAASGIGANPDDAPTRRLLMKKRVEADHPIDVRFWNPQ